MALLYELPRDKSIEIRGFKGKDGKPVVIVFGHLDGAYSYCWLKGHKDKVVHLSVGTPLKKVKEGVYELVKGENDG